MNGLLCVKPVGITLQPRSHLEHEEDEKGQTWKGYQAGLSLPEQLQELDKAANKGATAANQVFPSQVRLHALPQCILYVYLVACMSFANTYALSFDY